MRSTKSKMATVAIAMALDMIGGVHAEGGCPGGMIPYGSADAASCGPIPVSGDTWAAEPQWADRWGAIAGDAERKVLAAAAGLARRRAAEERAVEACRAQGGRGCAVQMTYRNQCVATIRGVAGTEHVRAVSAEHAIGLGMALCRKRRDGDCRVHYQACSFPVRVR